jgi:hypothetical protein
VRYFLNGALIYTDETEVGHRMSTKAVGSTGRVDITKLYKTVETPTGLRFNAVSTTNSANSVSSFTGGRRSARGPRRGAGPEDAEAEDRAQGLSGTTNYRSTEDFSMETRLGTASVCVCVVYDVM